MRGSARLAGAKLALFFWLGPTGRAPNRQKLFFFCFHNRQNAPLSDGRLVNFDQSLKLFRSILTTGVFRESFRRARTRLGIRFRTRPPGKSENNVVTQHNIIEASPASRRTAPTGGRHSRNGWRATAIQAIVTEPHCGGGKSSSAAMWNRHFHHRSVRGYFRRVWNGAAHGASRQRHRRRI